MIQLKMAASVSINGPTKKKIPTTAGKPLAPPQPIKIIEKVKVLMTKPTNPIGVGLAKCAYWGIFGWR